MKKVSVIMPVYNTECYLKRCIESLVHQTLKEIELIFINDGSTDHSLAILQDYKAKYPDKIIIIDKENGGMSDARNQGLTAANGEYIGFVDSDDYVDINMFALLYEKAKSKDFDVVACDMNYIYQDRIEKAYSHLHHDLFDAQAIQKTMVDVYPSVWNKLYHRRILEKSGLKFTRFVWFEDVEFTYCIYPFITSIGVVHEHLYQYMQREGSITKIFNEHLFDYLKNWKSIIAFYKQHGIYETYQQELEYSCVRYLYATFIKAAAHYLDMNMFYTAYDKAHEMVTQTYPNFRRNQYFYRSLKGLYLLTFNRISAKIVYKRINHKR